ncbi:MAG: hypothetical protein ACI97A_002088 [Planctomycetota bacterium]
MLRRTIKNSKDLKFVVIYTREPHARQLAFKKIVQPLNWKERRDLAQKTKDELKIDALFLIDEMGDPSRKLFGDVPNPAIFVEKNGKIKDKLSWADASEVDRVIQKWQPAPTSKPKTPTSKPTTRKKAIEPKKKSVVSSASK